MASQPTEWLRGRAIPVILPSRNDPRLRAGGGHRRPAGAGQVGLGVKLSVAQILVSIGVCALVEIAITYRQQHVLMWPASAILTGNSTAFILRANGTHHGDWWSLNGIEFFVLASLVGILSKYVIRWAGRHLYNPSNLGLVLCFLIIGATHVFPQYLWWGPMNLPVALALLVILAGSIWVLRPLQMLPMVAAFLVTFAILMAAIAASGGCFLATWHAGPICGSAYWFNICTSPELLVFTFFMISDPRTAPRLPLARVVYGVAVAVLAAALILPQPSEYGIKVAVLASLTVVFSFVLVLDRFVTRPGVEPAKPLATPSLVSFFAAVAITPGVPSATVALASISRWSTSTAESTRRARPCSKPAHAHAMLSAMATSVYLEAGAKRVFACALDWPGWCRNGKTEEQALAALAGYAPRYAVVAREAGIAFPVKTGSGFDVMERIKGTSDTDFGVPGREAAPDRDPLSRQEAEKFAGLLAATWTVFDRVVAAAPPALRKGPRGGGRDRDAIREHVIGAESMYARKMGIRSPQPAPRDGPAVTAIREAMLEAVRSGTGTPQVPDKSWPVRYAVRRAAWHELDHAWEIEDRRI